MLKFLVLIGLISLAGRSEALISPSEKTMLLETEKNNVTVYKQTFKSIVNVSNIRIARSFWDFDEFEVPQGSGSGFVWDDKGHIVTNFHVVQGSDSIIINFEGDKNSYKAKVVGVEPNKDIAVLKVEKMPKELVKVAKGTSKNLAVGQKVIAIGNPFGLDHTMTVGIVSAIGRKIKGIGGVSIQGMIQTDASINPGNSGGPLFDSSGKVIGMNTMIFSSSGSSAGIGFAVPIDTISRIVPQLIEHGKVIRPALGLAILTEYQKRRIGINRGVVIKSTLPGGAAYNAGLEGMKRDNYGNFELGDILLEVDGKAVDNIDDIYQILDNKKIGEEVSVKFRRNRKTQEAKLKLKKATY